LKGANIFIENELKVNFQLEEEREIPIKNLPFLSLSGRFKTNLSLPPFIGLGKFVFRGFGTVQSSLSEKSQ